MKDLPVVRIIDATLREGMQAASGTFTREQSVDIARALARCGVDMVECGHPAIGHDEQRRVAAVVEAADGVPVLAHARAIRGDIDAVVATGASWVGIFLGVNDQSQSARLPGYGLQDLYLKIADAVSYARKRGLRVRFTIEDGSRTGSALLMEAFEYASEAGADRICVADTVGLLEPPGAARLVRSLVDHGFNLDIEVHFHDDRGLALANALSALDAGARWVSTSVNGLGERAGIVDLSVLLTNLFYRGSRSLPEGRHLQDLSRRVGAYSRSAPDDRRPVVGKNVFRHASQMHVRAVERDPTTYEWIRPERKHSAATRRVAMAAA